MGPSGGQIIDELIPMLNEAVTTQTIDEETVGALLELQSGAAEHAEKRTGKVTKKQMVEIIKLARTYEVQPRCYIGHQWDKEKIKEGRERLEKAFENLWNLLGLGAQQRETASNGRRGIGVELASETPESLLYEYMETFFDSWCALHLDYLTLVSYYHGFILEIARICTTTCLLLEISFIRWVITWGDTTKPDIMPLDRDFWYLATPTLESHVRMFIGYGLPSSQWRRYVCGRTSSCASSACQELQARNWWRLLRTVRPQTRENTLDWRQRAFIGMVRWSSLKPVLISCWVFIDCVHLSWQAWKTCETFHFIGLRFTGLFVITMM